MGDGVKLPVIETVKLSVRWTAAIVSRHWKLVAFYALALILGELAIYGNYLFLSPARILKSGNFPEPKSIELSLFLFNIIYTLSIIPFCIIVHNEVLRGPAAFNSATLGERGKRIIGYILDSIALILVIIAFAILIFLPIIFVFNTIMQGSISIYYVIAAFIAIGIWLTAIWGATRLTLRLPSRALGVPLDWSAVWKLGKGQGWRLIGGEILLAIILAIVFLPLGLLRFQMQLLEPEAPVMFVILGVLAFISSILNVAGLVALCAFLSLAYAYLRNARPEPVRAEPRF